MEILRVPPHGLEVSIQVSEPDTEYAYVVQDMADFSSSSSVATSGSNSKITVQLPSNYDGTYLVVVDGEEHEFEVVRPYVDPNTKGTTASEISEYAKNERLARAIIDSITMDGFYYRKRVLDYSGNGSDYLPVWGNVRKVIKVLENNTLVFDADNLNESRSSYEISKDKTAIVETHVDAINRSEGAPLQFPAVRNDYLDLQYAYRGFPRGFDYSVVVESGYKNLPQDIVIAAEMLIDDISCGRLDYYKRYISDYNTDQFKIKFDSQVFEGTGNIVVDKILAKFTPSIKTLGAL